MQHRAKWSDMLKFFRNKQIYPHIGFLLLYYASIMGLLSVVRPYMVDLGYNMKQIGLLNGIVGIAAAMLVSYPAGIVVRRWGIEKVKVIFAVLIMLATIYFVVLSLSVPNLYLLIGGIIFLWICYGMGMVVVYTSSMYMVRNGLEGTDFTLQIVITHISGLMLAIVSGKIADVLGYTGLFSVEAVIAFVSLLYVIYHYRAVL